METLEKPNRLLEDSKHHQTSEDFPPNVTVDTGKDKSSSLERQSSRKRGCSNSTDVRLDMPKKKSVFEEEELILRDKLLEGLGTFENPASTGDMLGSRVNGEALCYQDRKIIKLKGELPNLALPDGWLALNHRSGGIIYLHRATRVCTWARPYYLGKGSVRKHDVPVAAIPCLHQKKALNRDAAKKLLNTQHNGAFTKPNSISVLRFLNNECSTSECSDIKDEEESVKKTDSYKVKGSEYGNRGTPENGKDGPNDDIIAQGNDDDDDWHVNCDSDECGVDGRTPNGFHPKSGLDVIKSTLNTYYCLSKNQTTENAPISSKVIVQANNVVMANQVNDFLSIKAHILPDKETNFNKACDENEKDISQYQSSKSMQNGELIGPTPKPTTGMSTEDEVRTTLTSQGKKPTSESGIELIDSIKLSYYLGKLFDFEEVTYEQEQNVMSTTADQSSEHSDFALLPALDCLPYCVKGINARQNKGWVLNPGGKTPIAILHEYSQAMLTEKPEYVFSECENHAAPFVVEVQVNGITYGCGTASNKKQAKQLAAEAALEVFLPKEFQQIRDHKIPLEQLEYFDKLNIDDPCVPEVSIKSGLPIPSQVLEECVKRNQGVCSSGINFEITPGENQKHTFKISFGKHTAEGFCKNKKNGKQQASQALLKKLHPHISTWGSVLRIYCDRPSSIMKKYKTPDEDDLMTRQHSAGTAETPRGELVLARLKEQMRKIADEEKQDGTRHMANCTSNNPISTVDF